MLGGHYTIVEWCEVRIRYTVQYSQSQDLRGRSTNSSRGGGVRAGILGGGGQGPQKGNSVGIFIPTSKIRKLGGWGC